MSTETLPPTGTYVIDTVHSTVGFVARHLVGAKVRGRFTEFSGQITVADPPEGSSVTATIQAGSVDTGQEQRDAHLRSADFFDVETFPTIEFASSSVKQAGTGEWELAGQATIRGVARPITFELEYLGTGPGMAPDSTVAAFSAKADIDRRDFGVSFGGALDTGGLIVGNKVTLELDVEAHLQ